MTDSTSWFTKLNRARQPTRDNVVVVAVLVAAMVVIGGITRLTGSGLSMVKRRPIAGTLPPLNKEEWEHVFDL